MVQVGPQMEAAPTAVKTLIDPARVQVFPNPVTDFAQLQIDWDGLASLHLLDASGREMAIDLKQITFNEVQQLDVRNLPAGTYFLQFRNSSDGALLHTRQLKIVR